MSTTTCSSGLRRKRWTTLERRVSPLGLDDGGGDDVDDDNNDEDEKENPCP